MENTFETLGIILPSNATGQITTLCPKCSHTRQKSSDRCLSVNVEEGIYKCHHCGYSGSIYPNREEVRTQRTRGDYTKPTWLASSGLPDSVVKYFRERGISKSTLEANDIQYREKEWFHDGTTSAIMFPFKRGGETVNIKYRSPKKSFKQEKDAEKVFYGLDGVDGETLIICEGEMDKLSFDEIGYTFAVSVPDGAPAPGTKNYSSKFDYLNNCEAELSGVTEFILAVDNDEAGQTLEYELARRLGFEKCFRVIYPEGCKDANEVLVKHGKDALKAVIGDSRPFPIAGVISVPDIKAEIIELYENGVERVFSTGWTVVDDYYKVRPGEMTIVTGFPGDGKSEFMDALLLNLAKDQGWQFGVCSLENIPHSRHVSKLVKKYIGEPFFAGLNKRMNREALDTGLQYIGEHFKFISPDEATIDNILKLTKSLIFRNGIKGLIIDPYNMLIHKRQAGITETEYIAQFLAKVRLFARKNDIAVWIVAHPSKVRKEDREAAPSLYDIAGSAHWANMADNGLAIYRPKTGGVEIAVKKIRFSEVGQRGSAFLEYNPINGRYSESTRDINNDKF